MTTFIFKIDSMTNPADLANSMSGLANAIGLPMLLHLVAQAAFNEDYDILAEQLEETALIIGQLEADRAEMRNVLEVSDDDFQDILLGYSLIRRDEDYDEDDLDPSP